MSELKASDLELTYDSDYLTNEFYESLLSDRDAAKEFGPCVDFDLARECAALLNYEARLLDQKRYKLWLEMFTADTIYWVPYDDEADIRTHVNLMFDDRRRLEDRVLRLLSRFAYTLAPQREFQHIVSNVEAWDMPDGRRRVLASQIAYEYRRDHAVARHIYRTDHTLRLENKQWKIAVKRCVLLNIDAAVEPPTLL